MINFTQTTMTENDHLHSVQKHKNVYNFKTNDQ